MADFDLTRRKFMMVGTTSLLAIDGDVARQVDGSGSKASEYDFQGVADLLGPLEARPEPGDGFFDKKIAFAYRYEATDGGRYFIENGDTEWTTIMANPQTQVDEVRVEDYKSFFDHTFARPEAPDDKNWIYTDADVTKQDSEIELAGTTVLETTQHGNYPPGTESIAGWAGRLTGQPTGGTARTGYYNDQNGFGSGEDATDSFVFLRKNGTDHTVYRPDWNGYVPSSRLYVNNEPVITRCPHLFYGGGSIRVRALIHENNQTQLRTLHTFTPDNTPSDWAVGPPFDQPNLPIRFETESLTGGSLRANAAHYERGESDAETRVNGEHFSGVSAPTDDWVPLLSWQKRSGWDMVNVRPLKISVAASGADAKLELQLNPSLSSATFNLPTHTDSDECAVEVTRDGDQGSITADGQRRWPGYVTAGQGNKSGNVSSEDLSFNLPNNQIVTLAAQGVGGSATLSGTVGWKEFF